MTHQADRHPADEIGKALSRAAGILTSLSNCYDKAAVEFDITTPFIFEAVTAVEKLVERATAELTRLCIDYDLGKLLQATPTQEQLEQDLQQPDEQHRQETLQEAASNYIDHHSTADQVSRLASKLDTILETMPVQTTVPASIIDRPAQTYSELFEKLTAMANAASDHAQHAPHTDQYLLPVLESLRLDMLRLRSVA